MIQFLSALLPLIGGFTQPIKDYFASKAKQAELQQQLEITKIQAQTNAIVSGNEAQIKTIQAYLNSVSQNFRQGTFYFLVLPVIVSVCLPDYAQMMWHNFEVMPHWFQVLFVSVYSVIWGLPLAKEHISPMFQSLGRAMEARREYKLEKARIDRKAVTDVLRKIFPKGFTQEQVNIIDQALDAGENNEPGN